MAGIWRVLCWLLLASTDSSLAAAVAEAVAPPGAAPGETQGGCGGVVTGVSGGVIATPGFPGAPPTPLHCRWLIDVSHVPDAAVVVYLTQQYLTSGLTFTEYAYYESEAFNLGARKVTDFFRSKYRNTVAL